MKKNFLIIHYNTPYLTECLVRSINLFVEDAFIYIFDNSTDKPFKAKFDNVTIFDNTKGKIINFNEWLNKYPKRNKSHGRVNQWGSAKHCYSVEKCMELIDDNFVLLDSDVLLKRDVSNLFIENSVYVGDIVMQPNSSINRVLPFICFINVKMCKENGIHYFDDNHMHGLWKTAEADRYDTGAAFYLQAKDLNHREIKCSNYVVHYGHGSWHKDDTEPKYNVNEWLKMYKKYWSNEKNKKVVYTCITGGYDTLLTPKYISEGFDYVCFTDNKDLRSDIWDIRPLPKETEELSQVKKQRYVKINPHLLLSEYEISIWVDGNVTLKGDLNKFVNNSLNDRCSVYVPKHPSRDCIYKEALVVVRMGKDKSDITNPQIERYRKEGFPEKYGLLQSNILLRRHNNEDCIKLMTYWFEELRKGSHRDQLSFNYALWKNQDVNVTYLDKNIYKSEYFYWKGAHSKPKPSETNMEDGFESIMWEDKKIVTKNTSKPTAKNVKIINNKADKQVVSKKLETHNIRIY